MLLRIIWISLQKHFIFILEKLLLYDVQNFDVFSSLSRDTIALTDESLQLHFLLLKKDTKQKSISDRKWSNILSYRVNKVEGNFKGRRRKNAGLSAVDFFTIPSEEWMKDYECTNLSVSNGSVLILLKSKNRYKEDSKSILVSYRTEKNTFHFLNVEDNVCLCSCNNPYFPTLLISNFAVTIPTFDTSQEQLIDTVS